MNERRAQAPIPKPVDWDDLYPGRFLKAGQLGDKKPTLTIASVDMDELEGEKGPQRKGIISFRETPYQLALNKTNGLVLRDILGRSLEGWIGKRITLYRGQVESGSQRGEPAVRIWGSPEIDRDRSVTVQLPRKRPFQVTVHAVRAKDAPRPSPAAERPAEPPQQAAGGGEEAPPFGDREET